jgi:hypothetical protein
MDWNGVRAADAAKATGLLQEAGRMVFQARLEIARAGVEPEVLRALEDADKAVARAAEVAAANWRRCASALTVVE